MFKLLVLVILLSMLTLGLTLPTRDSRENSIVSRTRRMLNGKNSSIEYAPWQVALLYSKENKRYYGGAGNIISMYWVLTVAHCVCPMEPGDAKMEFVSSGSSNFDDGAIHRISETKCHPNFEYNRISQTTMNDVAVVRVADPFQYGKLTKPIELPMKSWLWTSRAVAYGWGSVMSSGYGISRNLNRITMDIFPTDRCLNFLNMVYSNKSAYPGLMCAGGLNDGYICYGDSGGSLVQNNVLVGLISWIHSDSCGVPNYPGVFVDVYFYRDWIERTIGVMPYFNYEPRVAAPSFNSRAMNN